MSGEELCLSTCENQVLLMTELLYRFTISCKSLPHHCCCRKSGLIFIFLLWQQHFLFITHFHKDHKQESINFI